MQEHSLKQQQLEALEELFHYSRKLIPAIETVIKEINGNRQEDTDEFLKTVIDGLNWVIEVLNLTMDRVNEEEVIVDKEKINSSILLLGQAIKNKDDEKIAGILTEDILLFLTVLSTRAGILTNQAFN